MQTFLTKCKRLAFNRLLTTAYLLLVLPSLLFAGEWQEADQIWKVQGKITSADDPSGLPGATVMVKGTNIGTITDIDGKYTLEVPSKDATLIFSFIGFNPIEQPLNGRTQVSVEMQQDVMSLEEVVVVGYGEMKRSDVTGAMVSISSEEISKSVVTSVDQALTGRAAGVQIQQNSGAPGSSSSINIRGINSISGSNQPIFVIDGVIISNESSSSSQNPLSIINPADIESIDVLKDASATAIYGSRAANGVIIITTRQGKKNDVTINYNGYAGWQEIPKELELMNLQEFARLRNTKAEYGLVTREGTFVDPDLLGEGTKWQEELFRGAWMQNHNLSVSGGSDKSTYSLSLGYLDQEGMAIGSSFERINLRGVINSEANSFLNMGVTFALANSEQNTTIQDNRLIQVALRQTPNVAVRNANGDFDGPATSEFVQNNPVALSLIQENSNTLMNVRANTFLEAKLSEGLTFKTEFSADVGFRNTYRFNPSYQFGAIENTNTESNRAKSFSRFLSWRNIMSYNKSFGVHSIQGMLGHEMQESHWESLSGFRSGFLTNDATNLNAGDATTARNNGSATTSSILSFFGRVFYSYEDRYLLTTTLRRDGSSKFSPQNRWGLFPSLALAWKVSNEPFFKGVPSVGSLKLRVGWGIVGNQNTRDFAFTSIYSTVATPWGTGALASNTANPDLRWESTTSSNIGLDLTLFNNRVELIADAYYKRTKDLLLPLPLPAYAGTAGQGSATAPVVNIGQLENKGIELTLNTVNYDRKGLTWRTNFTFTRNLNKVLELANETAVINEDLQQGSDQTIVTRTVTGQPIGQFYGYKVIGRFERATDFYYRNSEGEIVPTPIDADMSIGENSVWVGDYIFADLNNDGVITEEDRTFIGNPQPDFTFGIGNTFSYKGFDLTIFINGSYGNEVLNYQRRWMENPRENHNLLKQATQYAQVELINPDGPVDYRNVHIVGGDPLMPRLARASATSAYNYRMSDRFIEDGSFLRIQNISFGYHLPQSVLSKLKAKSCKVYVNLQNVYTFTKYSGYDPEVGALNQNMLLYGIDNARYPSPRIYTTGVNVTF